MSTEQNNSKKGYDPKVFSLFATERMEDYLALSLALVLVIAVLLVHQ